MPAPVAVATGHTLRGEIRALTGIRAVAAIAVVMSHLALPRSAPRPLAQLVNFGYIGVPLFFMLSGFVLAYNYPRLRVGRGQRRSLGRFYMARIARVMPLYWLVLLYLMINTQAQGRKQAEWWWHALAVHTWSGNLRIGQQSYNGPAWSVCVEIFLYAILPFLLPVITWLAGRFPRRGLYVVIVLAFAIEVGLVAWFTAKGWAGLRATDPRSAHRWLYRNPLTRIPDFTIGIALALLFSRGVRMTTKAANVVQVLSVVYVLFMCMTAFHASETVGSFLAASSYGAEWSIPFAAVIFSLASAPASILARLLSTNPMVSLGAASYALYITHRSLIDDLGKSYANRSGVSSWALTLCILGLVLFVGEGAHRYVELPARRMIMAFYDRHIYRKVAPVAGAEPAAAFETDVQPEPVLVGASAAADSESEQPAWSATYADEATQLIETIPPRQRRTEEMTNGFD